VPYTAITAQIHQALDIHRDFAPEVTLYNEVGQSRTQIRDLGFCQILDLYTRCHTSRGTDLLRPRSADAKDRRKPNHNVLI
jgi:hypothetical protein